MANDIGALCVRFRIDALDGDDRLTLFAVCVWGVPFVVCSKRPFIITLFDLIVCWAIVGVTTCFTWKLPFGCRILENGRVLKSSIEFGFRGNSGGDRFSNFGTRIKGFRVDEDPAKLLRRLGVLNLASDCSDFWRICRNISGGGGGNGSSWLSWLVVTASGDGGGGKSGLGTRQSDLLRFFGGRSGIQSSSDMIGPITTGPSKSFESDCLSMLWSRYAVYSAADDVLWNNVKTKYKFFSLSLYSKFV